jgi:hypothetical protein
MGLDDLPSSDSIDMSTVRLVRFWTGNEQLSETGKALSWQYQNFRVKSIVEALVCPLGI